MFKRLFLVCFFLLAGCATTTEIGTPIRESAVNLIEKGKTTEQNLLIMFGKPYTESVDHEGNKILHFNHSVSVMPFGKVPEIDTTQLIINIDSDGIVKDYQYIKGNQQPMSVRY